MRRRRKRTLRAGAVLWLLVLLNLLAAAFFSRLTAVREIAVTGARLYDRPRLESILARLRGIPHMRMSDRQVETEILREPSVLSAEWTSGFLGRATLRIEYRRPVAKFVGFEDLALDDRGVIYSSPDLPADLTPLELPGGTPPTLVGLVGDWPAKRFADLAVEARTLGPPGGVGIQVDREGAICLNVGAGRVVLGSFDDLDHKLKVLGLRLKKNPDELSQIAELVLTHPDRPAIVKK